MTMLRRAIAIAFSATLLLASTSQAQASCATTLATTVPAPTTAPGVKARIAANGLNFPRGIIFDSAGHLLVVDRGVGVKVLTLQDDGGTCVYVTDTKTIIQDATLNHGIEFSEDGKTLYVSSVSTVYQYAYDPSTRSVSGNGRQIITGMFNSDHSTRTILRSRKKPNTLVINRGSAANIDNLAIRKKSGHAQVKAFDLDNLGSTPFDFTTDGFLLGWGLRNNVGVSEHPVTGGIWTVENSVDDIKRGGVDFHQQNPGEKLNYMGTLVDNNSTNQGSNFGYPTCFAAWAPSKVPNAPGLKVGQQFSIKDGVTDAQCRKRTAPSLVFDAHTAPLDIKFRGGDAFVSFHGSHDRDVPHGYTVSRIDFTGGQPVAPSTSKKALYDLVGVQNKLGCPRENKCLRPVGLVFDDQDRLFFSSDYTGEIYVVTGALSSA